MKAQELRIGNLIKLTDNTEFKVVGIHIYGLDVENELERTYCEFEEFEGIPITEEWLLKFGWVWNEECKSYEYKDIRMNLDYRDISNSYTMFNYVTKSIVCERIYYVHQLQNLHFALTNEELTLNAETR